MEWLELYGLDHPWGYAIRITTVIILLLVGRALGVIVVRWALRRARTSQRLVVSERRMATLDSLLVSTVTFFAIITALVSGLLWLGANSGILFPLLGLFGAGFGLGVRPLVSDYLAGFTLLFENSYAHGEKVEIMEVMGTVERVGIRTTLIRGDTGELFVVPNGDVRVIRNFSRGAFSMASVRVAVRSSDVVAALSVLDQVATQAANSYGEELVERPEVISETGDLGATTVLTVLAKARFAHGIYVRRALLTDVHNALAAAGIHEAER